jgi:hypothetical protein
MRKCGRFTGGDPTGILRPSGSRGARDGSGNGGMG